MSDLDLQRLRAEGQAFMEAISRESYLASAGHKKTAELQPIYQRYDRALGTEALELTREQAVEPGPQADPIAAATLGTTSSSRSRG